MNCVLCNQPVPKDMDDVVEQGWIPEYYLGPELIEGPVCPACLDSHLRLNDMGEWEARVPKKIAHRYN